MTEYAKRKLSLSNQREIAETATSESINSHFYNLFAPEKRPVLNKEVFSDNPSIQNTTDAINLV